MIKDSIKTEFDNCEVDLHIHSYFSDGQLSPQMLINRRFKEGIRKISLTDHDGVGGLEEGKKEAERLGISFVSGIEISSYHNYRDRNLGVHILGYGFDPTNSILNSKMKELEYFRKERNEELIFVLNKLGYKIDIEDIISNENQTYIGKPLITKALIKKRYIKNKEEAFGKGGIFENPEVRAISKKKVSSKEAITLIKNSGGVAVLAHPGRIRHIGEMGSDEYFKEIKIIISRLKDEGLEGIESWYGFHSQEEKEKFAKIGRDLDLILTRGSDFHDK